MLRTGPLLAHMDWMAHVVLLTRWSRYGGRSVAVGRGRLARHWTWSGESGRGRSSRLADDGVVAGRHGGVVCVRRLLLNFAFNGRVAVRETALGVRAVSVDLVALRVDTWVAVEDLEERLICVMVEVVDLVALGEEVGNGLWRRLVGDGGADDVGDIAPVLLGWYLQLRV